MITIRHSLPRIILSIAAATAVWLSTAAHATGVELVALATSANGTSTARTNAGPEQTLASIHVESGYDAAMRGELLLAVRYPNRIEARREKLQGKVAVEFEVDRQGALKDASIAESSRSRMLDAAALASLHWAKFAPFPAALAPGESSRRYRATFDYRFISKE
jgi:TonB family protein